MLQLCIDTIVIGARQLEYEEFAKRTAKHKKNLTDLPPIFAKKAPTGRESFKRFLNLEPFIPICKLANKLTNKNPRLANQEILDTIFFPSIMIVVGI